MMRPSAPDKHGGTVHSWAYIVSTYPTLSTGNKFFITFTIKMQDKKMGMKYKNPDTCLEKLCMKFFCKSHKTAQTGELFGQRVPSPSLFTLHWPTLLPLAVTMKTWDRVISPTPHHVSSLYPTICTINEQHLDNKCTLLQYTFRHFFTTRMPVLIDKVSRPFIATCCTSVRLFTFVSLPKCIILY
jgi:hypothetical protein